MRYMGMISNIASFFLLFEIISKHAKFKHVIINKHVLSLLICITVPIQNIRAWFSDMNFVYNLEVIIL